MDNTKTILTAAEAAKVLRVSRPVIYRLCRSEGFPAVWLGRAVRIPADALEHWMKVHSGEQVFND